MWWRSPPQPEHHLPVERFGSAVQAGIRYAGNNPHLRATLVRAVGFFLFASAYWALLPLVARRQVAGGPELYGILLGTIGAAAVGGALALRWLNARLGPDRLVAAGTLGTAMTLVLFGLAHHAVTAVAASLIAGVSWIVVLSSLNVSAQLALPEWVRGRGLAMYVTVMFGTLSLGSVLWGEAAGIVGLSVTQFIAAAGALAAIPLTWRWKLQTGAGIDLTPSMHWPAPITTHEVESDRGPVFVTVEYTESPQQTARRSWRPSNGSGASDAATARMRGAYSKTPRRTDDSLKHFSWSRGSSTSVSTNASRMPTASSRTWCSGSRDGTPTVTHFVAAEASHEHSRHGVFGR